MTWKERRTITILTTILLVLSAILLVVLGIRYREHRDETGDAAAVQNSIDILPAADPNAYTALTYTNGTVTLSFTQDSGGVWLWDADKDFPLDDTQVTGILALLTNWRPQQVLKDREALDGSGMEDAVASLTATTAGGGTTTLLFGKATTDGLSDYVRLNGDETTVYIIDGALRRSMDIPIYDMCRLPELPALAEADMRTVTLQGPAPEEGSAGPETILLAQSSGGTASWRCGGADVTNDSTVRALMEDLTALKVSKCVDYAPSEEAAQICGFDSPQAVLRIVYAEDGQDAELTLTVGGRLLDKSGRYVRLGEEPAIYLLETALLDPMMRIAANGLE